MTDKNEQQNCDSTSDDDGNELNQVLKRRQSLNDAIERGDNVERNVVNVKSHNVYVQFQECSRKEIKDFEKKFKS